MLGLGNRGCFFFFCSFCGGDARGHEECLIICVGNVWFGVYGLGIIVHYIMFQSCALLRYYDSVISLFESQVTPSFVAAYIY